MAEAEKVMGVSTDDIEKIMGVETGDIEKVMGVEFPAGVTAWQGDRALLLGGERASGTPVESEHGVYHSISTLSGDWANGGEMGLGNAMSAAVSNITRLVNLGGSRVSSSTLYVFNTIEYRTFASPGGQHSDFGDTVNAATRGAAAITDGTTGLFVGGGNNFDDEVQQITIASAANATDVGTMANTDYQGTGASNATRGIYKWHQKGYGNRTARIEYATISSPNTWADFGDLRVGSYRVDCTEDSSRVWMVGGFNNSGTALGSIEYITTASTADSLAWGDLGSSAKISFSCAASNNTRAFFMGGYSDDSSSSHGNTVWYFTLASTGDASDGGPTLDDGEAVAVAKSCAGSGT